MPGLNHIIRKYLSKLENLQEDDGSFLGAFSFSKDKFQGIEKTKVLFNTALISAALAEIKNPTAERIKKKANQFLLKNKSDYWSWNYWPRKSQNIKERPYPDDLDDTFCSLYALYSQNKNIINSEVLAKIVNLLTILESREGGPYKTWLVDKSAPKVWQDVDIAVNSNIASFLSLLEIDLPPLNQYLEKSIRQDKLSSPYYINKLPILYYLTRINNKKILKLIRDYLCAEKIKTDNLLEKTLLIISKLRCGLLPEKDEIKEIISSVECLRAYAFHIDLIKDGRIQFFGSCALTLSLAIESIFLYDSQLKSFEEESSSIPADDNRLANPIVLKIKKRFDQISHCYPKSTEKTLQMLSDRVYASEEKNQIISFASIFNESLKKPIRDKSLIENLSLANFFGWISYTAYDDILDDNKKELLAAANISSREMVILFHNLYANDSHGFSFIMDRLGIMDCANQFDHDILLVENYSENFKKLTPSVISKMHYQRSIGCTLVPLIILDKLGHNSSSREFQLINNYFENFISAKQLSDDAHDWIDDLKKGKLNLVSIEIIKKHPEILKKKNDDLVLQKIFWLEFSDLIFDKMIEFCDDAFSAMEQSRVFANTDHLYSMVDSLKNVAIEGKKEKKDTTDFIKNYFSPPIN